MKKRVLFGFILMVFILAGCAQARQAEQVQDEVNRILTQSAIDLATVAAQQTEVPTETPVPVVVEPTPTATPDAAITITSVEQSGEGRAIVNWEAYGNYPSGYALVWTSEQRKPVYPDDSSSYAGDPNARSAMMSGEPGYVYVVRVCRVNVTGCDLYSEPVFIAFGD